MLAFALHYGPLINLDQLKSIPLLGKMGNGDDLFDSLLMAT